MVLLRRRTVAGLLSYLIKLMVLKVVLEGKPTDRTINCFLFKRFVDKTCYYCYEVVARFIPLFSFSTSGNSSKRMRSITWYVGLVINYVISMSIYLLTAFIKISLKNIENANHENIFCFS